MLHGPFGVRFVIAEYTLNDEDMDRDVDLRTNRPAQGA